MTNEVMIGAAVGVASAVVGSLLTAWTTYRFQLSLLEKQIEMNKQMHAQLIEEQQAFAQSMERDRRQHDRMQDMAKEARQRSQNR